MGGENAQIAPSKEGVVKEEEEGVLMLAKKVPSELSSLSCVDNSM